MFSKNPAHHVLVDVHAEGQRNLLGNSRTTPRRVTSFHFNDGIDQFLDETDTDGLVILHRGKVVLERYGNGMTSGTPHILMSVSKSLTAVVAGILIAQGKLDPDQNVVSIIPALGDSVYSDATVRHVLDMRVGPAMMVASVEPTLRVRAHDKLKLALKPERLHLFDAESEAAI